MAATIAALFIANSVCGSPFLWLLAHPLGPAIAGLHPLSVAGWINDGLMAVFSSTSASNLKREMLVGELRDWRRAGLADRSRSWWHGTPICDLCPGQCRRTWQPRLGHSDVHTDIAFALAALGLSGSSSPGLVAFLLALAIADDLGAIVVIASCYAERCTGSTCWSAVAVLVCAMLANRIRISMWWIYAALGIEALVVRSRVRYPSSPSQAFALRSAIPPTNGAPGGPAVRGSALEAMQVRLRHCVMYGIVPIFALSNAGAVLDRQSVTEAFQPVPIGVIAGLVLGKPFGIVLTSWFAGQITHLQATRKTSGWSCPAWRCLPGRHWLHYVSVFRGAGVRRLVAHRAGEVRRSERLSDIGRDRNRVTTCVRATRIT